VGLVEIEPGLGGLRILARELVEHHRDRRCVFAAQPFPRGHLAGGAGEIPGEHLACGDEILT